MSSLLINTLGDCCSPGLAGLTVDRPGCMCGQGVEDFADPTVLLPLQRSEEVVHLRLSPSGA